MSRAWSWRSVPRSAPTARVSATSRRCCGASPSVGEARPISLQGQITAGSRSALNVAVVSGTALLDLGDGLPPALDIPFTATLVRDPATAQGTVGLVIGSAALPSATLNEGSLSIQTVPAEPLEDPVMVTSQ